ncbi:sensor domain-containing diguanylate cyclase [Marinobacter salexigens]|uniref:diguanylate cyclase n=1 Tax=Marinobacter salexigens TaxID=1925763 RepID=A0ABS6A848_9GAMM|nr:sensor domain-containing diguanylate cyclase [Marinobacter salexigens]MBU2873004.1 GGDEF domain-containing protein [Marinobacter salexigens]
MNTLTINIEQMAAVLDTLPDPVFILSRSGKYVAVYGGRDERYYHSGSGLVGLYIADVVKAEKADWFLEQIDCALKTGKLVIKEYELSSRDVKGVPDDNGPVAPIWFEARIQALDFLIDDEAAVLWVASNISERHDLEIKLREFSDTDQLTGLFNRRRLERDLALYYETFERYSLPTSILMLDLDHLKTVNDTLGHHAGDEMIREVADVFRTELRKTDTASRFGGDEFVIVLPNTEQKQAVQFAERLCECVRRKLQRFSANGVAVTVSLGVTVTMPEDRSFEATLKRADKALYEAKKRGRNQVVAV